MAKPKSRIERLPPEMEELACELVIESKRLDEIAKAIGLKNAAQLTRYMSKFPEFFAKFEDAQRAECLALEEEIRYIPENYNGEYGKLKMEALTKLLKWRNQKKYGDRQQIEMSVSVDISGALDRAEKRIRDVIPTNVIPLITNKPEGEE